MAVKTDSAALNASAKVKRERKEYEKLGQTKETPDESDPCRIFYESLLSENPRSMLAKQWLLERGLIPNSTINKVFEEVMKHKGKTAQDIERLKLGKGRSSTPSKTTVTKKKSKTSVPAPRGAVGGASSSRKSWSGGAGAGPSAQAKRKSVSKPRKPAYDYDDDDDFGFDNDDDDVEVMPTKKVRKFM